MKDTEYIFDAPCRLVHASIIAHTAQICCDVVTATPMKLVVSVSFLHLVFRRKYLQVSGISASVRASYLNPRSTFTARTDSHSATDYVLSIKL